MSTNDYALTAEQQKVATAEARAERLKRWIIVIGSTMVVTIVVVVVTLVVLIRNTQQEGSPAVKEIITQGDEQKELLDIIRSCVEPDGKCAKDNASKTAEALGSIQLGVVYAVTCGVNLVKDNPDATVEAVQECVANLAGKAAPK